MAQTRNVVCKFYESEGNCDKDFEGTFKKACQTCSFYSPVQRQPQQKRKRQTIEPDDLWRKKKAKDRDRRLKQKMIEDLENEDGVR